MLSSSYKIKFSPTSAPSLLRNLSDGHLKKQREPNSKAESYSQAWLTSGQVQDPRRYYNSYEPTRQGGGGSGTWVEINLQLQKS
jgi:hypothetical protein